MSRTPKMFVAATALLAAAACGAGAADSKPDGPPDVVAAFYPLQWVTEQVGGADIKLAVLTPPGVEPHDLELSAKQVAMIDGADLTVYIKGVQPAVDEAVEQYGASKSFDTATAVKTLPLSGAAYDPHLWLDPSRLATIATRVGERLAAADPAHAQGYKDRAARTAAALGALDQEFTKGLATCQSRTLVTSHEAFGYLADRYKLKQIGITLDPEAEPSPTRILEVAKLAKAEQVTTIFTEALVSPKVAEVLAKEVGANTQVLDPLESKPEGDYPSAMRKNLANLQTALRCTP
ncbi:MAG: zinc ABC transporter substrate-binding protein [Nonomuraea sp.]|nr:zinc ABC transporter substrate-binding protein [Nonomuraea sp.]